MALPLYEAGAQTDCQETASGGNTEHACRHAHIGEFAVAGERVLVVAGVPFGAPGSTNNLRIAVVGPDGGTG